MARYSTILRDQNEVPISGAVVSVINPATGALATLTDDLSASILNPITTGALGEVTFNAADNVYRLEYRVNGIERRVDDVIVGMPSAFAGPAGPAFATYFTLANFKAAATSNAIQVLQATGIATGIFYWETANAPYTADNVNIIKADSTSLSIGAWVRQSAAGISDATQKSSLAATNGATLVGTRRSETGAVTTNADAVLKQAGLYPADFGIAFDGTDETIKLQAMVNAGHASGLPIYLTGGTIKVSAAIDLRGKYVRIIGAGHQKTTIQATASMVAVFRADETGDTILSPYLISDLAIDGNSLAQAGILTQFRHGTEISRVYIQSCTQAGLREKDAWNNVRTLVISYGSPISFDLQGANNACVFTKCAMANASDTHLKIGASNVTSGLSFIGCDIEYGPGKGVTVAAGCSVDFDSCYVGEGIEGVVFENSGETNTRGGLLNWGSTATAYLVRPLAGRFHAYGSQVGAMTLGGMGNLFGLTNAEVDAGTYGCASFERCVFGVGTTPQPINGDVLDWVQGRCFVPRFGQDWAAASVDGTVTTSTSGSSKTMTVTAPGGSNVNVMRAPLTSGWQQGKPVYIAVVYSATKSVSVRVAESAFGAAYSAGTLPAASRKTTMIFLASTPVAGTVYQYLEFQLLSSVATDTLTIHKVSFSDGGFLGRTGVTENLGMVA